MLGLLGRNQVSAGLEALAKGRFKRARALLAEPAAEGDGDAAYHLALLLWRGQGGPEDREGALALLRQAADDDVPAAQNALGVAHVEGRGAPRDLDAARALFRAAADRAFAPALMNLAALSTPDEARTLLTQAASAGHTPAMIRLCDLVERDEPEEALCWLYAAVALTGDEAAAKRAKALARELRAGDIASAQAQGRAIVKDIERAQRRQGRAGARP